MTARLPAVTATLLAIAAVGSVSAQRPFEQPQEPCDVTTGHFLVNGAMMHLKVAAETDNAQTREDRLGEAYDVLNRAIRESNQADNPGAWYYLGRYYVERGDPFGADSAFGMVVAMLPQCEAEAARYLSQLQPAVRTAALEAWQAGAIDSAAALFKLAGSLSPRDPEAAFYLARMYADNRQFDSAAAYVDVGMERAGDDPAHDQRKRQALGDLIRAREAAAFESPAIENLLQLRLRRDSLERALARDERRLADLVAEWSGKNLRPETREAVQRDSTMLADRIAAGARVHAELAAAIVRDSTAAHEAFRGAIAAYARYLEQYPDDTEAAVRLLRRYSLLGDAAGMDRIIGQLAAADSLDLTEITQAGTSIFNDGHAARAIALLDLAVERNPYMQSTLSTLARSYYQLGEADPLRETVEQLLELDPLNPQTMRLMAAAWDLAGNSDSVMKYVALADTGLGLGVTVTQFIPSPVSSTVNGSIMNMSNGPSSPAVIEFEFLDARGSVLGTATVTVPALEPKRRHAFTAEAAAPRAAAWRYRLRGGS
jgi:Flp pilus assembly protein TadD/cytochrome c-type biogenesis protein CcmH/NrfG